MLGSDPLDDEAGETMSGVELTEPGSRCRGGCVHRRPVAAGARSKAPRTGPPPQAAWLDTM